MVQRRGIYMLLFCLLLLRLWKTGQLLNLAYDLGLRLLPAFETPTGIPYARVMP